MRVPEPSAAPWTAPATSTPRAHLRPLSPGEILDGAFTLYRRHFATFVATALLARGPLIAMWAFFVAFGGDDVHAPGVDALARVLATLGLIVALGALTQQASAAYLGQPVTVDAGLAAARRHFFSLSGVLIVQWLAMTVGMILLVVPGLLAYAALFAVVPVVVLEKADAGRALWRTRDLSRQALGRVLVVVALLAVLTWLPVIAAPLLVGIGIGLAGGSGAAPGLQELLIQGVHAVTLPLQAAGVVLLYYDRRVRTEALDLAPPYAPLSHPADAAPRAAAV